MLFGLLMVMIASVIIALGGCFAFAKLSPVWVEWRYEDSVPKILAVGLVHFVSWVLIGFGYVGFILSALNAAAIALHMHVPAITDASTSTHYIHFFGGVVASVFSILTIALIKRQIFSRQLMQPLQ